MNLDMEDLYEAQGKYETEEFDEAIDAPPTNSVDPIKRLGATLADTKCAETLIRGVYVRVLN